MAASSGRGCRPSAQGLARLRNVCRKRDIPDRDEYVAAAGLLDNLDDLELSRAVDDRALRRAAALASDRSLRILDALVVDLAVEVDQPPLTSDAKLARAAGDLVELVVLRGIAG